MTQLIEELFTVLRPVLRNRAKTKKILERYWKDKIAIVWETKDVHRAANERGRALTEKEAVEILSALYQNHNAQAGIKWSDIYDMFEEKCVGRELTKRELNRFLQKDILIVNSVR
jgi:hypothetical protein